MDNDLKFAAHLHEHVPPDWYYRSIKENIFQRYWHKRRFDEVSKMIEENNKGIILDIGSADGTFTNVILQRSKAKKVTGIDVLEKSVDWANKHWDSEKLKFQLGDAHKLNFKPDTFDAVVALEVLEHVKEPKKVLREIKRVLKKGGYAVFLVPSDSILFKIIWFFWTKSRGKIWQDTHIQTYRNDYLVKISKGVGFKIEESKKFILDMLHLVKVRKT